MDSNGQTKEIPAYCVNPTQYGVPQTVADGESVEYIANEKASDPKLTGIVANGYPNRSLGELGLENKYQGYYATKMALWCYLLSDWDIADLKVNPSLTGDELTRAQNILAAANKIYRMGTAWTEDPGPSVTCTPDRDVAYEVTVNGKQYKQQIFTVWSQPWVSNHTVNVAFTHPDDVPEGTHIVDMNDNDTTTITTEGTGDGYAGQFKVLYPLESVAGQTGSVQLSFHTNVYQYAIYYAVCAETNKYGQLQDYLVDSDPTITMRLSAYSSYGDEPTVELDTGLRILKYETGTTTPISGALFEVIGPDGDSIGTFATNSAGKIELPLNIVGNHTVIELASGKGYLLGENTTQNVTVVYDEVAEVTFYNDPYGSLRVEKKSDTGENLAGAVIQVKHIQSGQVYTKTTTTAGVAMFSPVTPGVYEITELASPSGWECTDTKLTTTVVAGETTTEALINKELPGLRIIKYDRVNMLPLPDVTFEIWHDGELYGRLKTDQLGEILIPNAEPGTWLAFEYETGNPAYILDTTPQQIELESGDGIRELLFFNDQKPGLHLTKVDATDPSKVIAGAVFEIKAVDGSYGPKEFVTGQDGGIDLSILSEGSYVVTEKSCNGYVIDEKQRIIHLDPNENAEFVFTNTIKPSLRILKLSSDGTPLEGVTFRISYIEDGTRYLDRVTNSKGLIELSDMDVGVLSIQEISTVSDHILDAREYHVQLFPGKTSELVMENQVRPNLTVWKFDADDGVTPVEGAAFLVEYADGHSIAEVTTGPDGSATVENLLPSVVKITEKSVPSPYLLDAEPQLVTLYPNRDRNVYFYNHQAPSITIVKEDSITHQRLDSVKFQVFYASNKTNDGEYRDLGVFTTDENGEIHLSRVEHGLEDGWFKVQELEPKAGYAIKGDGVQEAFVQSGKAKTFLFENTPLSAIVVWKYDSETSLPIEGTRFQLRYLSGTSGTGGTVIGTYETSANGSITITGLKAGAYVVEELSSDSDHVVDTPPQTVYLSGEERDVISVSFGNAPKASPTRQSAHEFIEQVREQYIEPLDQRENFIDYVAHRPGAHQLGEHGLWNAEGKVPVLAHAMQEVAFHPGIVWTPVVSLRREDAERLGYADAENWRALVNATISDLVIGYKIHPDHLRWYAAFHEKQKSVHVHMVIFSSNPKEGYLTKQGIRSIKSAFARQIYHQDLICVYERQTEHRNTLQRDAQERMSELIHKMEHGTIHSEKLEQLTMELAERLKHTSGKKVYGYLPPKVKRIVDEIVDELAKDERAASAYALWQEMREEVCRTYSEKLPERLPLSQQKEFKPVRNMVIREALRLSEMTFSLDNETTEHDRQQEKKSETEGPVWSTDAPEPSYSVYEQEPHIRFSPEGRERQHSSAVGPAVIRMLHHMGRIFRKNTAREDIYTGIQMDRKRRRALQEKRLALGHKADDHETQIHDQRLV